MDGPRLVDVDVKRLADERVARDAHLELLEADPAVRVVVGLLQPRLDRLLRRMDSLPQGYMITRSVMFSDPDFNFSLFGLVHRTTAAIKPRQVVHSSIATGRKTVPKLTLPSDPKASTTQFHHLQERVNINCQICKISSSVSTS